MGKKNKLWRYGSKVPNGTQKQSLLPHSSLAQKTAAIRFPRLRYQIHLADQLVQGLQKAGWGLVLSWCRRARRPSGPLYDTRAASSAARSGSIRTFAQFGLGFCLQYLLQIFDSQHTPLSVLAQTPYYFDIIQKTNVTKDSGLNTEEGQDFLS